MPRPRVFISSTFYDLRQVRADLEVFVKEMGYDAVLNERGHIAYGADEKLEEYAYQEVETCDILVAIIGGRFGTGSQHEPFSISHVELQKAAAANKQIYIFIERSVRAEYETYLLNKDVTNITYRWVDDRRVFDFIEDVFALPANNPVSDFETASDIVVYLREQWAGLFQRMLQQQGLLQEARLLSEMHNTVRTLKDLVTFLTEERGGRDQAIQEILLRNHPLFDQLRALLGTRYRIFFVSRRELEEWLTVYRWTSVNRRAWDEPEMEEWILEIDEDRYWLLKIATLVFDDEGHIRPLTADEWRSEWVRVEAREYTSEENEEEDRDDEYTNEEDEDEDEYTNEEDEDEDEDEEYTNEEDEDELP